MLRFAVILAALGVIAFPEVRATATLLVFMVLVLALGGQLCLDDLRLHREGHFTWAAVRAGKLRSSALDWFWPPLGVWALWLLVN